MFSRLVAVSTLILLLGCAVYSQDKAKQSPVLPPSLAGPTISVEDDFLSQLNGVEEEIRLYGLDRSRPDAPQRLTSVYGRAVQDSRLIGVVIARNWGRYTNIVENAKSAMQVSQAADEANVRFQTLLALQNQTLIEQNRRIIQLLEEIVKKK